MTRVTGESVGARLLGGIPCEVVVASFLPPAAVATLDPENAFIQLLLSLWTKLFHRDCLT
jgi:hypothetical protein